MTGNTAILIEIALYLVAFPLLLFPGPAAPLGFVLLAIQALVRRYRTGRWLPATPFNFPILLFLMTALLGLLVSPDRGLSLNRFWVLLLGIATFYTLVGLVRRPEHFLNAAVLFFGLGVCLAVASLLVTDWTEGALQAPYSLAQRLPLLFHLPGSGVPNPADGVNPRIVAGTLALFLPLALAWALFGEGKSLRLLGALAVIPLALPLVLSQSPQAYLALVLALSMMFAFWLPWLLIGEALLAAALSLSWHSWRGIFSAQLVSRIVFALQSRLEIWRRAVLMLRDMPFTGSGLNAFPVVADGYGLPHSLLMPHAHNIFLQTAVDQGVLGLVSFVLIFTLAFIAGWRLWRSAAGRNQRLVWLGCTAGCLAYLAYGLFDSISLGNKPAFLVWALLGLLAAGGQSVPPSQPANRMRGSRVSAILGSPRLRQIFELALCAAALLASPIWTSALFVNLARVANPPLDLVRTVPDAAQSASILKYAAVAGRLYAANSRAWVLTGLAHHFLGQKQDAIDSWERALVLDGADPLTQLWLADAYHSQGQDSPALLHWAAAGAAQTLFERGTAALDQGNLAQARYWFEQVISLEPDNFIAQQHLAQVFSSQKDWAGAIEAYRLLFRINQQRGAPPLVLAQNLARLGGVLVQSRQLEAARQAYLQALHYDPANSLAQKGLANLANP
jgi:putative inorganic carbon (hco3(-)) transporter